MDIEEKTENAYKGIFKSTVLFGFVQVFTLIVKVGTNKAVALLLGVEGMGIIGLFQSTINILKVGFDLGLSQSTVRDISEAKNTSEADLGKTISLAKRLILFASLLGAIVTIVLAPYLSKLTFGNTSYKYAFMLLSLVVFLNILTEGQLAILKGMRMLRILAKASLFGSIVGLFTSVPLYFFLREKGIVPSLITAALTAFLYAWFYVRKIPYIRQHIPFKNTFAEGKMMIKMGIALMYVSFLGGVGDYIVRTFISRTASLEMVGLFQSGSTIITAYFGIVITALTTDYYPRISAINKDNQKLSEEFNKQSEVSLLIMGPLVIIFLFAMSLCVKILYSNEFLPIIDYLEFAVFGVLITICSNALGMILLAKQATNIFFITATIGRVINVLTTIILFKYYGLKGIGIASFCTGIFHLVYVQIIMLVVYNIKIEKNLLNNIFFIGLFSITAFFVRRIFEYSFYKYLLGIGLLIMCLFYSLMTAKIKMNIDVLHVAKTKMKRGYHHE
jgi:PST family polysaccharide transporter